MPLNETLQVEQNDEIELDLVTHDIRKFFKFLLRPNRYVLEQLLSPIVVHTTPEHEEVKALIPAILTRHHAHHYLGFADSQWRLFQKQEQPRIKPLLYTFRVLLTGVHLMRTGTIEANLGILHEMYPLPFVPDLMARKLEGAEQQTLASGEVALYEREFQSLRARLVTEASLTALPEVPTAQAALNDILIRVRLGASS